MIKKNKIGIILVGLYLLFTVAVVVYSQSCTSEMFCDLTVVFPIMPWPLILKNLIGFSWGLFALLVALNSLILYFIGKGLSNLFRKDIPNN